MSSFSESSVASKGSTPKAAAVAGGSSVGGGARAMEWMPDNASAGCLICTKQWSLKNRRHHCRRCGRLVCDECSQRKYVFDEAEGPKRTCDDCYESVTRKQIVQQEVNYHRERESQLIHASSKVSDSLLRVYFLDGTFKTAFYDESTTASEIASKIVFSVKIALFEVEKDIKNPSEYCLIPGDEYINNVVARWDLQGLKYAKIVIPMNDATNALKTQQGSQIVSRAAPVSDSRSRLAVRDTTSTMPSLSTAELLAEKEKEREARDMMRASFSSRQSFSMGSSGRSPYMSTDVPSGFDNSMIMGGGGGGAGGSEAGPPGTSSRSSGIFRVFSRSSGVPGTPTSSGAALSQATMPSTAPSVIDSSDLADLMGKIELLSTDNAKLTKDLNDLRKKYDILRTIHTKSNKNSRELKKEVNDLRMNEAQFASPQRGSAPAASNAANNVLSPPSTPIGKSKPFPHQDYNSEPAPAAAGNSNSYDNNEEVEGDDDDDDDNATYRPDPRIARISRAAAEKANGKVTHTIYEGPMKRKSTGFKKNWKNAYVVLNNVSLSFYKTMDLQTLEFCFDTKRSHAVVDPRDEMCFKITCEDKQLVLKCETKEFARDLVSQINVSASAPVTIKPPGQTGSFSGSFSSFSGAAAGTADKSGGSGKPNKAGAASGSTSGSASAPTASGGSSFITTSGYFANKVEEVLEIESALQMRVFLDKVAGIEAFFRVFDNVLAKALEQEVLQPQQVTHTYEIVSAMQNLYATILDYGENWTKSVREWLLILLRKHMSLPVKDPEVLMAVIQCISRENMMFSPDTSEVVNEIIEKSFASHAELAVGIHNGASSWTSTEHILEGVTRMIDTLNLVVSDLVPLLPEDFNVITMYQQKANKKIKSDISTFYAANKNNITIREVLTLLTFADSQKYYLSKFGVDTTVVDVLNADLLKHYRTMVQTLMRQWIGRIYDSEIPAEPGLSKGIGLTSPWPEDLVSCVGEQLNVAVRELKPSACQVVCAQVVEALPLFLSRLHAWLESKPRSQLAPEKLCAYVNNFDRFSRLLDARRETVITALSKAIGGDMDEDNDDDEASSHAIVSSTTSAVIAGISSLDQQFKTTVEAFKGESRFGLNHLTYLVCQDFRNGLKEGLFQPEWFDGPQVIDTLKSTLDDYCADLRQWLASPTDVSYIVFNILRSVTMSYLELLLIGTCITQTVPGVVAAASAGSIGAAGGAGSSGGIGSSSGASSGSLNPSAGNGLHIVLNSRAAERLGDDIKTLVACFSACVEAGVLTADQVEQEFCALRPVVELAQMDPRRMSTFVHDVLYKVLGSMCMRVWHTVMTLRNEPKELYGAVYDAIMLGWEPVPIKAQVVLPFQDKLRALPDLKNKKR